MTDIQFAKEHTGEYFRYKDYEVRVIGYDVTGVGNCVIIIIIIIDHPAGWHIELADPSDVINEDLCETGRCRYVNWEDLK